MEIGFANCEINCRNEMEENWNIYPGNVCPDK
jgi:hypothetical protein